MSLVHVCDNACNAREAQPQGGTGLVALQCGTVGSDGGDAL